MKRIEFLAPVAAMRGNLTGNQVLDYPTNNGDAWVAPEGSYATNYTTRYIGAKRAADGHTYFATRQTSRNPYTAAQTADNRLVAAAFAINAASVAYLSKLADFSKYVLAFKQTYPDPNRRPLSPLHWLRKVVFDMIYNKQASVQVGKSPVLTILNPLSSATTGGDKPVIPAEMQSKFAAQITALTPA